MLTGKLFKYSRFFRFIYQMSVNSMIYDIFIRYHWSRGHIHRDHSPRDVLN